MDLSFSLPTDRGRKHMQDNTAAPLLPLPTQELVPGRADTRSLTYLPLFQGRA